MRLKSKNNNLIKPKTVVVDSLKYKSNGFALSFIFQALLLCVTLIGFLYSVSTSAQMTVGILPIIAIAVPLMVIAMLFTLNNKVFIAFISVFVASSAAIMLLLRDLRIKIVDSFLFYFNVIIKIMVDQGYSNYQSAMTTDITELLEDSAYVDGCFYTVIVVLAIVFAVLFASTLVKRSWVLVAFLPCFLVLTPSLYFGSTPSGVAFSIFISGVLGCYTQSIAFSLRSRRNKIRDKKQRPKNKNTNLLGRAYNTASNGFAFMCVSLVLSLTVSLSLFSSDGMQINVIRDAIDVLGNKIMNVLFYESYETAEGAIGGLLESDILELKTPKFRDLPVMTVSTRTNSSLYLRGWIGKDIDGTGWKILGEDTHAAYIKNVGDGFNENTQFYDYTRIVSPNEIVNATSNADTAKLGFVYDTVSVKAKYTKSPLIFTPVKCLDGNLIAKHNGVISIADTILMFNNGRSQNNEYAYNATLQTFADRDFYLSFDSKQYTYEKISDVIMKKTGGLTENEIFIKNFVAGELKYREYVRSQYMTVPDKSNTLRQIALQETASYERDIAKALAIERYLKTNYSYAKKFTSAAGDAMDKVNYMIKETKTGYCTYFATAMTVMMRQLGYPARYVTGYHAMVTEEENTSKYVRSVKDANYHAWVEVYFDGIGWLTFDPTPGVVGTVSVRDYDYLDDAEWEEPSGDEPVDIPPTMPAPTVPVAPEESEITDIIGSDDEEEKKYEYDDLLPLWAKIILIFVGAILLVAVLLYLLSLFIKARYKAYIASLHTLSPNELLHTIYPDILRLLGSLNYRAKPGEMITEFADRIDSAFVLPITFKSILETLEMSQFSENEIDFKSASRVYEYYMILSDTVFVSLNKFKKYYYMATLKKKRY